MFNWGAAEWINCVYFAAVAIGLVWTLLSLMGGGFGADADLDIGGPEFDFHIGDIDLGGVHVPAMDLGVDSPDVDVGSSVHLPSISSFAIATFLAGFGGAGIITSLALHLSIGWSLIAATFSGLVLGGAMQLIFGAVLLKAQGSSEVRLSEVAGMTGEVTVPIPADGLGQIAFVSGGRRVTYGARSSGNVAIPRGAQVQVVRIVGGTAVVHQMDK